MTRGQDAMIIVQSGPASNRGSRQERDKVINLKFFQSEFSQKWADSVAAETIIEGIEAVNRFLEHYPTLNRENLAYFHNGYAKKSRATLKRRC